jgi:hypothetical protein
MNISEKGRPRQQFESINTQGNSNSYITKFIVLT